MTGQASRIMHVAAGTVFALALIAAQRASAEVSDSAANGFTVRQTVHIAAAPDRVYAALIAPQRWWSSKHSFSGNAANMSLDAKQGGCWCEMLPNGGFVEHMRVVYAVPGKVLRLRGAMGPFQAMPVEEVLTWTLVPAGDGTDVTLVNGYGGYAKDGLDKLAPVVDGVVGEQIARLRQFIETGTPATPEEPRP
jgi:uncharacterized protein YndB with AHSA1/START domain